MKDHRSVVVTTDPEIMGGSPVFSGTRMPVRTILAYIADGYTDEAIMGEFPTIGPWHLSLARQMYPTLDNPR